MNCSVYVLVWSVIMSVIAVDLAASSKVKYPRDEKTLIRYLLYDYETRARPVRNSSRPVHVKFSVTPIQVADVDEVNQVFSINVWLAMVWYDERLQWNPAEFNNITKLLLPQDDIWLPDIVLYNSDEFTTLLNTKVVLEHTGEIFWGPPTKYYSSCQVNVKYFPFDVQTCILKFGSWMYDGFKLHLDVLSYKVDTKNYLQNGEWGLVNVSIVRNSVIYNCCPEPYYFVVYEFTIKRRVVYYMLNIILPCLWLSLLSVMTFRIPPDSGEKITLGITVLLAFSVFSLLIAESMPRTSESIPLIGVYLNVSMSMTSISIIMTVHVLHIHHVGPRQRGPPDWLRKFAFYHLARFLYMRGVVKDFIKTEDEKLLLPRTTSDVEINPIVAYSKLLHNIAASMSNGNASPKHTDKTKVKQQMPKSDSTTGLAHETVTKSSELEMMIRQEIKQQNSARKKKEKHEKVTDEWRLLAIILDRLFFWLYLSFTVGITTVILIVTPMQGGWYSASILELEEHTLLD